MRALNLHDYEPSNTIVIAGSPRSGTTWLAQTIAGAIPGAAVLFEPDHVNHVPLVRPAGLADKTYVPPGAEWPDAERALEQMLRGRVLNEWTVQSITVPKRVRTWIVKFIRVNRRLPWLAERFQVRSPVLIVRHPCAVVASQIAAGWGLQERPEPDIRRDFPQTSAVLESVETPYEHCAVRWAIDTLIPLRQPKPHRWMTVPFESLVGRPEAFTPIFERWDLTPPNDLERRMRAVSSTTRRTNEANDPVRAWTTQLTKEQVRSILSITHELGLDFYGEEPEPDPSRWAAAT